MIPRSIVIANGKGGVGKTSVAVNLAGALALSGYRMLLVDLDPQANVSDELGLLRSDGSGDGGESFKLAVMSDGKIPIQVVRNVRENLDLVPAGENHTAELQEVLRYRSGQTNGAARAFKELYAVERVLAPLSGDYEMVLFDTPPSAGAPLSDAALAIANYLIIPTKVDRSSMHGLEILAHRLAEISEANVNPNLCLLGVVLFDIGTSHTAIEGEARASLDAALGGVAPVLQAFVRHAPRASEARNNGQLAYEYESTKDKAFREALATARKNRTERHRNPFRTLSRFGTNAEGLAQDYQRIAVEVVDLIASAEGIAVEEDTNA